MTSEDSIIRTEGSGLKRCKGQGCRDREDSVGQRPKHRMLGYFTQLLEIKGKSNQQSINIYQIPGYEKLQRWSQKQDWDTDEMGCEIIKDDSDHEPSFLP